MWMLFAAQLLITTGAPPLTPAQAVQVLRASHSPQDLTDYRVAPNERPVPVAVVERPARTKAAETKQPARESRRLQPQPTIGQCWIGVPCVVGPPTVIVRKEGR